MKAVNIFLCLLLVITVHGTIEWFVNQPQDAGADVPAGKIMSLSFASSREGFKTPLPEHIDEDLRLLADKTYTVRTYAILGGEPTADIARKYGINMIQGGWLGPDHDHNKREIEALIQSVNAHPDVVKRIIVGNEVMLRRDMGIDSLIGYIRQVRKAVKQPVSYADVWSNYMKYPQLINEVDFITIHILPYWEDEPVPVEQAAAHIEKVVRQIKDKALSMGQDKPILIGESGWPSVGRQRGQAVPSVVNSAKFIRSLLQLADRQKFDYNIIEAFNQPWKVDYEGVVGANWGLLSTDRKPVFPLTGPVYENPAWPLHFALTTGLWLLIVAAYGKRLQSVSGPCLLAFLVLAQAFSVCLITLADYQWHASYSLWQRVYTLAVVAANTALAGLLLQRCHDIFVDAPDDSQLASRLRGGYLFFMLFALYKTYSLAFNGRYLSFPVQELAIPALGVCSLVFCLWWRQRCLDYRILVLSSLIGEDFLSSRDRILACLIGVGAVALILGEITAFMTAHDFIAQHPGFFEGLPFALEYTFYNQQLLAWLLCLSILSFPFWIRNAVHKARI
ncbi:exo-beta-1,3-glucanase [Candidatus Methylobacter oryzae]|uniref:Endo-1,3-beta-glucanase btgC n=1 Tax=Candidatus Methylobacter oryzae TaxID=2497749 RepID=A0ABY3CCQ8_9GAMM|nr:exo-beta-1,3-glucanase [Candidatus Methylobacter oryzae]TRX00055.1 exo-beta-1,3-glucanase [Candidatus Methylobacter oryzae]